MKHNFGAWELELPRYMSKMEEEMAACNYGPWASDHQYHGVLIRQKVDYRLFFLYDVIKGAERFVVMTPTENIPHELPKWMILA